MTNEEIIREFSALPPEARRQVEDFITFLRQSYEMKSNKPNGNLSDEEFIGMWKDREDLRDSTAWIRKIRQSEWNN